MAAPAATGGAIVRSAWARAVHTKPGGFSVSAYDSAIRAAGGSDFSRDFARFAADLAEWRTDRVFRERAIPTQTSPARAACRSAGAPAPALNHTTFQLLRVHAHSGRAVSVGAVAPRGIAAGLAVVGRMGSERHGRVVKALRFAPRGGRMTVRLRRPGRFDRLTAVLVNADARRRGLQRPAARLGLLDRQRAVPRLGAAGALRRNPSPRAAD